MPPSANHAGIYIPQLRRYAAQDYQVDRAGLPPAQEWNSTTAYNLYDVVTYHNATYTCIQANINRQPDINPAHWTNDFQCTDIVVQRADTGEYQPNPFPSTSDYALTIANVDLEDAAGHALSLFESAAQGWHVNDIYIHDSAINGSGVTGIVYGADGAPTYHTQVCDLNPNWLNDQTVFAPRNLRIENNTFANNNTGAMGGGAVRWVGLRDNNWFTNNYIHPQVGNEQGCTIEFDPCADKLAFPARHPDGSSRIRLIEVVFSISGNDKGGTNGPDSGAGGCHFAYFPQFYPPLVYLDGPDGGSTWSAGSSVVGPGGSDLNNGYCTIHAGWTPAPMPEPYISPFISNGLLVIEFPPSSTSSLRKHIYTVVQDDQLPQGRVSDGGTWKYWGWWATQ